MKLPSIAFLFQHAKQSLLRFPLTIISSLVAVSISIYLVEVEKEGFNVFPFINTMLCAALGIVLFFCVTVFVTTKEYDQKIKLAINILAGAILVLLYYSLPDSESTQNTSLPYIRYALYNITIHLLVSFAPFLGGGQLNGFWHYNKILFIRFLTSVLYSGFLYGGLALALGSLQWLFDVDLHEELFFDLFIFIIGFFNTWFFVSGIPEDFHKLDAIDEYPKGLKVFSQYVLLSLLILYLVILYVYVGKIIVLWSWPKGIVSYLITCVAVLGILTLLLLYPYGKQIGNAWIQKFSKAYYFILVPLIVVLFIAIGMRLNDYGITINRYNIVVLGIWLTVVCAYFIAGKKNIKFIPVSLATVLVLISFGYWGMFSVSERSQVNRLRRIIEEAKILQDGKIQKEVIWLRDSLPTLISEQQITNEGLLSDSLHNEVKSILDYLDDHHGFKSLRGWFSQNLDSIVKLKNEKKPRWYPPSESELYMRSMGLLYQYKSSNNSNSYFSYTSQQQDIIDVSQFDYMIPFDKGNVENDSVVHSFRIDSDFYTLHYTKETQEKLLLINKSDTLALALNEITAKLISTYGKEYQHEIPVERMSVAASSKRVDVKLELATIGFMNEGDTLRMDRLNGTIFLKRKLK